MINIYKSSNFVLGKNSETKITGDCPQGDKNCQISERIAELNARIDVLSEQVNTDALTQLHNRRHLETALEQEMERSRRSHQATSIALLDADYFKKINDTYGHVAGDKVLIHIAKLIKNAIRKIDIACRYGGEEFALILPSTPLVYATQVAERIRNAIAESDLEIDDVKIRATVSIGVTAFNGLNEDTPDEILSRADKQLYMAKAAGRNCVRYDIDSRMSSAEVSQDEKDALFGDSSADSNDETPPS